MQSLKFDNKDDWFAARSGRITGSGAKDVITKRGTKWKTGVFQLIADRVAIEPDDEAPMDRGTRIEEEALDKFAAETGKKLDKSLVIWTRDDEENIAISPDGIVSESEVVAVASSGTREAVEAKCLSSAKHLEAYVLQEVPDEYKDQVVQYFVVNDELETLYFVFYDSRIPAKDFFYLTITRDSVQEKVSEYLEYEKNVLKAVNEIVNSLTF